MKWLRKTRVVPTDRTWAPIRERLEHPEARLPAPFEVLAHESEGRVLAGLPPGGVDEVRDAQGRVIDLRPRRYASLAEAGLDYRAQQANKPERRAEIEQLRPLAARWALLRKLDALNAPRSTQSASRVPKSPLSEPVDRLTAPTPPPPAIDDPFERNRIEIAQERRRVEAERRAAHIEGLERIEALRTQILPEPFVDSFAERVRLIDALTRWDEEHPALAAEIAAAEGRLAVR